MLRKGEENPNGILLDTNTQTIKFPNGRCVPIEVIEIGDPLFLAWYMLITDDIKAQLKKLEEGEPC